MTADATPSKEAKEPETKASKLDLSLTKIVGGALRSNVQVHDREVSNRAPASRCAQYPYIERPVT